MLNQESMQVFASDAEERSNLHRFLALVYRQEPSVELLHRVRSPDLCNALAAAGVEFDDDVVYAEIGQLTENLGVEYTRLFLGPGKHVPPYESVQVKEGSGVLRGPECQAVQRYIEKSGFVYNAEFSGLPDHISVELEFMSHLTRLEAEAWKRLDPSEAGKCLDHEDHFMTNHLGRWFLAFCDEVMDRTVSSFYREVARLTTEFLQSETLEIEHALLSSRDGASHSRTADGSTLW
jgi:TorA maturation chaperone TorD